MKPCPYCAEDIQDAAIVCKHCGRDLPVEAEEPAPPASPLKAAAKSDNRFMIGMVLTILGVALALGSDALAAVGFIALWVGLSMMASFKSRIVRVGGAFLAAIIVVTILMSGRTSRPNTATTASPAAATASAATTPIEQFKLDAQKDVTLRDATLQGTRLAVHFNVADNLTSGMIARGARRDVANIAKRAAASNLPFDSLFIAGYANMVDAYGKTSEDRVVTALFERSTLQRIVWANFNHDNIFKVADSANVWPQFR